MRKAFNSLFINDTKNDKTTNITIMTYRNNSSFLTSIMNLDEKLNKMNVSYKSISSNNFNYLITKDVYKIYKSLIFPIDSSTYNETDFLYFTLNDFDLNQILDLRFFDKTLIYNNIKITWSKPLNPLTYFPLVLITYFTKKILNIKYNFLLEENELVYTFNNPNIETINPFLTYFNINNLITYYIIFNILSEINLETQEIKTIDLLLSNHANKIVSLHTRVILKIIHSIVSTIFLININPEFNNFGFKYKQYKDKVLLVVPQDKVELIKTDKLIAAPEGFDKYISLTKLKNYNIQHLPTSRVIKIDESIYWYELFNLIDKDATTIHDIYIKFNKDLFIYVYPYFGFLNIFFELFLIKPDNVFYFNEKVLSLYFKKDSIIYAKPYSYIPISILPGIYNPIISLDYINSFVNFYNIDCLLTLNRYYLNCCIEYDREFLLVLDDIKEIIVDKKEKTIEYIISLINIDDQDKVLFHLLNNNNVLFKTDFNKDINVNKMNYFLLLFIFSNNIYQQSLTFNKNELLNIIKESCKTKYKSLKNKSDIYKDESCVCLYFDKPYPICFDTRCINNKSEYKINEFNKQDCSYSICSNGVDIDNLLVGGTASFINIITNTNCSNYNISNDFKDGLYYISFIKDNKKYNWVIDNNIITINNINSQLFNITIINNLMRIKNIYFKDGILTYNINKYNDFIVSLINDKLFLIDKKTGAPIIKYNNESYIFNHLPKEINDTMFELVFKNK